MSTKLHFGTDGIRGKADQFPFTPKALRFLGYAIALWSMQKYNKTRPRVLLGHDTRISCEDIKKHLCCGLASQPLMIFDGGVLPTPAVLQIIKHEKDFDFGIVISASHNPYTDNGIKLFDAQTGKLNCEDENSIIRNFEKIADVPDAMAGSVETWPQAAEIYKKNLLAFFQPHFLTGKKIVLDCANGATYKVAPEIFTSLGAEVTSLGVEPDGKNINEKCGALYPENVKNAIANNIIGFAFDGDGDRVIAVNQDCCIKDGDDLLAILLQHEDFENEMKSVGTIMTNYGFEKFLEAQGKKLIRTKVGDKYVAAHLEKDNLLIGGETSGHIIIRQYLNSGDGIFVALKALESMIINKNLTMETFAKTPQFLINVPILQKKDLDQQPYATIIDKYKSELINGRVVVRYSGTENVLRIMVEDQTDESTKEIAMNLSKALQRALS